MRFRSGVGSKGGREGGGVGAFACESLSGIDGVAKGGGVDKKGKGQGRTSEGKGSNMCLEDGRKEGEGGSKEEKGRYRRSKGSESGRRRLDAVGQKDKTEIGK
jgi:hypothetical protein